MSQKTQHSLTAQVAAITLGSTLTAILVTAISVIWIFEQSLNTQLNNHLVAYNDILVSAITVKEEEIVFDADNLLLQAIPRHWQIDLPEGRTLTSARLSSPFQLISPVQNGRFIHEAGENRIIAYRQSLDFPQGRTVHISFGLEEKIANAYKGDLRDRFSRFVYGLLGMVTLLLLLAGWGIILTVTHPIRRASQALRAVKAGKTHRIDGTFPTEISALTDQVNQLLEQAETVLARHRSFSSNIAHALKTPLTVIKNETDTAVIGQRVDDILNVVERNLARIQISTRPSVLSLQVRIKPILSRIIEGYGKVYQKSVTLDCAEDVSLKIDEADAFEVFGNLIENACKFAKSRLQIKVSGPIIMIEDDGPGIAPGDYTMALARGIRLDEAKSGSGIGLTITRDIIELYGGTLELGPSDLGGLKASIIWPRG